MRDILHEVLVMVCVPVAREDHVVEHICVDQEVPSGLGRASSCFWLFWLFWYSSTLALIYISASYLISEKGGPE
jgi:hypothetical protein